MRQPYEDDGALGSDLHPEFAVRLAEIAGTSMCSTRQGRARRFDRLSRFHVPDGQNVADPASELVLIDSWTAISGTTAAAWPSVREDGFLYVGVGPTKEGTSRDQFANGQKIDKNLSPASCGST